MVSYMRYLGAVHIFRLAACAAALGLAVMAPGQETQQEEVEAPAPGQNAQQEVVDASQRNLTPYLQAVWDGDTERALEMIRLGADPNQLDDLGHSAAHILVERDNAELILELANVRADIDIPNLDGITPIQMAASMGMRSPLRSLRVAKADLWRLTEDGLSLLELALMNRHQDTASYLVVQGVGLGEAGEDGKPPALRMVEADLPSWAWELISQVATARDVSEEDPDGVTALHIAAKDDRTNVITSLILAGANPNARDSNGNSPIHYAVESNSDEAIKILVDGGANPDIRSRDGETPLFTAARKGFAQSLAALIEMGADPDITNKFGLHPLHAAAAGTGEAHGVWALLEYGTDINIASNEGFTPLHVAAKAGNVPAAKALLVSGADPNVTDSVGQTPLYPAILNETEEMLKVLLSNGATLSQTAYNGDSPVDVARKAGKHKLAIDLLLLQLLPGY